jgi:serine/threonine protein kinase
MIGQVISHYKILEKLGEGGMGIVYKAEDTKLDRTVALKFLPARLAYSEQDKARFMQEARAAAALNHPNVCPIHDIAEHDNQLFIVMDFVEGHSLRERKQEFSIKQAVEIGIQIADGLTAAHEKGIVHRDIKPENIMLRKDGIVQIMDFGLAKLRGASRITKEGSTVGTAGYMSPEQVQGLETDHRTDLFSLGVILYELLAGQSPFKGVHETAIMYEVVNVDPAPISSLKPEVDPELDAIVLECLAKEPSERYQSAAEIAKDLRRFKRETSRKGISRVSTVRPAVVPSVAPQPSRRGLFNLVRSPIFAWSIAAILIIALVIITIQYSIRPSPELYAIRSFIPPPEKTNYHYYGALAGPAVISPDGKHIAFVAVSSEGKSLLYLRPLDALSAKPLPGTEGAYYPFWSADNKFVGFFAGPSLKKIDISGGPPVTICVAPNARGGTWNKDGTIIFSPLSISPLSVVSSSGGPARVLTAFDTSKNQTSHRWPYFLPDGKHFLYYASTMKVGAPSEENAIYVASLDMKLNKRLLKTSENVAYASGYLLFMTGSTLKAQRFDENELELKGDPVTIADSVLNDAGFSLAAFSASLNGVLVYQTGTAQSGSRLKIVDQSGKETGRIGSVIEHMSHRISPDGRRVVATIFDAKSWTANLWMYEMARGVKTRLTSTMFYDLYAVWSPDGSRIVFYRSTKKGVCDLYLVRTDRTGSEEPLWLSELDKYPTDWSNNGKFVAFTQYVAERTQGDIWVLPMTGDRKPSPFLQTAFDEGEARFSPNGKWVAYVSNETGEYEIYVRPFPGPGNPWKVSKAGGWAPRWKKESTAYSTQTNSIGELFYVTTDNKLAHAELRTRGSELEVRDRQLFGVPAFMQDFDVFPDGKRFLFNTSIEPRESPPITLVVNWEAEIRKK